MVAGRFGIEITGELPDIESPSVYWTARVMITERGIEGGFKGIDAGLT